MAQTLLISARPGAVHRSIAAYLSLPLVAKATLQDSYLPTVDQLPARHGGNSGDEFRGDEFQTRSPSRSRRFRPKPKSQRTNCRSRIFLSKLRQRAQERAQSRAQTTLARRPAVSQPRPEARVELA